MTNELDGASARARITTFMNIFHDEQQQLPELDRLPATATSAPTSPRLSAGSTVFSAMSRAFLATRGTSEPLFGMWFRNIARAGDDTATVEQLASGVNGGLAVIQKLGGAKVGDNTMIDAFGARCHPVVLR